MKKKLLALVLCLLMAMSLLPVGAYAEDYDDDTPWVGDVFPGEEEEEMTVDVEDISLAGLDVTVEGPIVYIDEYYEEFYDFLAETLTSADYEISAAELLENTPDRSVNYATTLLAAGKEVRAKLKSHPASIEVTYQAAYSSLDTYEERSAAVSNIWEYALQVTGNPMEGDYMRRSAPGWNASWSTRTSGSTMYLTVTYKPYYWGNLTGSQEQQMASAADAVLKSLNFTSKTSGYDKIKAIYKWIGDNIVYDYPALNNDDLVRLDQTAYSAIINRKTVCAGYSHLMYYMMWKSGIPCRYIVGKGAGGNHAWNLVYLRGKWYSMDVTWDAGYRLSDPCTFDWFLRGKDSGFYGSGSGNTHATNRDSSDGFNNTGLVNASSSSNYGSRKAADAGKCTTHTAASSYYKTDSGTIVHWCSVCGQSKIGSFTGGITISNITANKSTAKVGDTITWTATASGSGTLQYCFYILKDGTTVKKGTYSTARTFNYKPTASGAYTAKVYVKNSSGTVVNKTGGKVTVGAATPITISSVTANKSSANVGDTITWTAAASGGSGSLQYCFYILKDGTTVKKGTYGTGKTFSYKPTASGTYTAKAFVKDSSGTAVNKTGGTVKVSASTPLTIASVTANKSSANVGDTITWTANASGGSGTLQYCFYIMKDGVIVNKGSYGTGKTASYKITSAGTYTGKAFVKDAAGTVVNKTGGTVTAGGAATSLSISSIKVYQMTIDGSAGLKWTATATGGSGSLQYCFYVYRDGELAETGTYGSANSYSYKIPMKLSGTHNFEVKVYVKDSSGAKTSKTGGSISVTI